MKSTRWKKITGAAERGFIIAEIIMIRSNTSYNSAALDGMEGRSRWANEEKAAARVWRVERRVEATRRLSQRHPTLGGFFGRFERAVPCRGLRHRGIDSGAGQRLNG